MNRMTDSQLESTIRLPRPSLTGIPERTAAQAWDELAGTNVSTRCLARARVVTHGRSNRAHVVFDTLRTKLLQSAQQNGWQRIAVTSPRQGCGTTSVVLNLAFSFGRLPGFRTVVLDANFADPQIAPMLALPHVRPLAEVLSGPAPVTAGLVRVGEGLAIGAQHTASPGAADSLQGAHENVAFDNLMHILEPDIVLIDAPPMLAGDDTLALLPHVDAVLLVAGAGRSTIEEIEACEREIANGFVFAGLVLNKCRYLPRWRRK